MKKTTALLLALSIVGVSTAGYLAKNTVENITASILSKFEYQVAQETIEINIPEGIVIKKGETLQVDVRQIIDGLNQVTDYQSEDGKTIVFGVMKDSQNEDDGSIEIQLPYIPLKGLNNDANAEETFNKVLERVGQEVEFIEKVAEISIPEVKDGAIVLPDTSQQVTEAEIKKYLNQFNSEMRDLIRDSRQLTFTEEMKTEMQKALEESKSINANIGQLSFTTGGDNLEEAIIKQQKRMIDAQNALENGTTVNFANSSGSTSVNQDEIPEIVVTANLIKGVDKIAENAALRNLFAGNFISAYRVPTAFEVGDTLVIPYLTNQDLNEQQAIVNEMTQYLKDARASYQIEEVEVSVTDILTENEEEVVLSELTDEELSEYYIKNAESLPDDELVKLLQEMEDRKESGVTVLEVRRADEESDDIFTPSSTDQASEQSQPDANKDEYLPESLKITSRDFVSKSYSIGSNTFWVYFFRPPDTPVGEFVPLEVEIWSSDNYFPNGDLNIDKQREHVIEGSEFRKEGIKSITPTLSGEYEHDQTSNTFFLPFDEREFVKDRDEPTSLSVGPKRLVERIVSTNDVKCVKAGRAQTEYVLSKVEIEYPLVYSQASSFFGGEEIYEIQNTSPGNISPLSPALRSLFFRCTQDLQEEATISLEDTKEEPLDDSLRQFAEIFLIDPVGQDQIEIELNERGQLDGYIDAAVEDANEYLGGLPGESSLDLTQIKPNSTSSDASANSGSSINADPDGRVAADVLIQDINRCIDRCMQNKVEICEYCQPPGAITEGSCKLSINEEDRDFCVRACTQVPEESALDDLEVEETKTDADYTPTDSVLDDFGVEETNTDADYTPSESVIDDIEEKLVIS